MENKHSPGFVRNYLLVPAHICDLVIKEGAFRDFQIYIFLKARFRGNAKLTPTDFKCLADELSISKKTFDRSISKLRRRNWIGYDAKNGIYYFRGFEKIKQLEKLTGRASALLTTHTDIHAFQRFKAFVIGASFGNDVKRQKWQEVCKIRSEQSEGTSYHHLTKQLPSHFPLACAYLAKKFGIVISTASSYKKLAARYGFLDVIRNQRLIDSLMLTGEEGATEQSKGIPAKLVNQFKKVYPDHAKRVRIKKGYLYLDEPDTAKSLMEFRRRHIKRA